MPMRKRLFCALLTALMLLTLLPSVALETNAVSNQRTSEECIAILKEMEGFIEKPVWDHKQYSVGYGTRCERGDYPNGITKEQADELLREYLAEMEEIINKFAQKHGIVFAQHQFDAIMLFTYNCGTGWTSADGKFRTAVIKGYKGNDFLYPISLWSTASDQVHTGLLKRRLIEADMYLNGSYTNQYPINYTYVLYDNNGGEAEDRVQGFDYEQYAAVNSLPFRRGYRFLGWYTQKEGGSWVTELGRSNAEKTLFAHWQEGNGDSVNGSAASYSVSTDRIASLELRDAPNGTVQGSLNSNTTVQVVADYVDSKNVKWGKVSGGWINLGNPLAGTVRKEEVPIVSVKVTGDYVNVRTGPGTMYSVVAGAARGDKLEITEVRKTEDGYWGLFRAGWICLDFTSFDPSQFEPVEEPENGEKEEVIGSGSVTASSLNIRRKPGTGNQVMGAYKKNTKVVFYEVKTVDGTMWGRTDMGWISLSYVKLDKPIEEPVVQPDATEPTQPEEEVKPTEPPQETQPDETEPEIQPTPSEPPKEETEEGVPGTVISKSELMIRKGPGTGYQAVGSYPSRSQILVLEQKTVNGVNWGRTNKGWVCMQYVKLAFSADGEVGIQGTVISNTALNVRAGAGVSSARVGSYKPGTRVTIYEQTVVSGQKWGRAEKGWVCLDYVKLDTQLTPPTVTTPATPDTGNESEKPNEQEPEQKPAEGTQDSVNAAKGTVTASGLNIRAKAGTNAAAVGAYRKGDKVAILEQKIVDGIFWGRTDQGWISLAHVKMDAQAVVPGGFTVTVTATGLNIRKGPGTGYASLGGYRQGDKLTILETQQVGTTKWGRTEVGWISMDYVK